MKTFDADSIYALLPLSVRKNDQATGGALQALIGVIAAQANIVDDNLYQLYDDLFIETCSPWAIPYIGDLVGYRQLRPIPPSDGPARVDVADTIGLRRRKGTLVMIDELARDVTSWNTVAVEYFALLAVSQYVRNHVRLQNACVDVHGYATALDIGGALDVATRSADVRRIASGRGRYNIPNVGVFVWRLQPFGGATLGLGPAGTAPGSDLVATTACNVGANRYTFDPFGDDVALVNPPQPLPEFELPTRANVQYSLRRFPLYDELEGLRAGTIASDRAVYFGASPVLAVYDASGTAILPQHVAVCDLSAWAAPTDANIYVAVDPELGRIACNLAVFTPPSPLRVSSAYLFSGPYGGGSYARTPDLGEAQPAIEIGDFAAADASGWTSGVVEIGDSGIHLGDMTFAPSADGLVVRAEDFARPVISGSVTVVAVPNGKLTLRGLGIGGALTIVSPAAPSAGSSASSSSSSTRAGVAEALPSFTLTLEDCTVRGLLQWTYPGGGSLNISKSLCAALYVDPTVTIAAADSVIDAGRPDEPFWVNTGSSSSASSFDVFAAIAGADGWNDCGKLSLSAVTVLGDIRAREIGLIENSIVTGTVIVERTQAGCVRYSYLPPPPYSQVPPRFRCQPDLAIDSALAAAQKSDPPLSAGRAQAIADAIEQWLQPAFTSRRKGSGGYVQLADSCPREIATGAASADEMGAFHGLYNPRREGNLRFRFEEFLRIGLDAGIIHAV